MNNDHLIKNLTTLKNKVCKKCSKAFMGIPNRRFCADCRALKCLNCENPITRKAKRTKFCSHSCYSLYKKGRPSGAIWSSESREKMRIARTGKNNPGYGKPAWSRGKKRAEMTGDKHFNWKGGFWINNDGYKVIQNEAETKQKKVLEHRRVMGEYLGRKLESTEIIHHINHNKLDNRIENLMIVTRSEHVKIHPAWRAKQI